MILHEVHRRLVLASLPHASGPFICTDVTGVSRDESVIWNAITSFGSANQALPTISYMGKGASPNFFHWFGQSSAESGSKELGQRETLFFDDSGVRGQRSLAKSMISEIHESSALA
jgi:hypothetical protein